MARILLVDDESVARSLYGDVLGEAGHTVTAVASLAEARAALSSARFDVVVTDLILPEGDGMDLLEHIKERHTGVEVVVITALDRVDPAVRAIKSGAAEYLVKPVGTEALQHAVRRALASRQLLVENASLRQHVMLLETGKRIATTLDRERLVSTALAAFGQLTHASAVLLFTRDENGVRHCASQGLPPDTERALVPLVEAGLVGRSSAGELDGLPSSQAHALAFPAAEASEVLGWVVLLFEGPPAPGAGEAASFLAHHLGLGLRNLGRFAQVEDLAYLDDLTHLFNTRYLQLAVDREVEQARRSEGTFSLLFLDLDHFKSINDTHGHRVGSKLLIEVGRILKGCVRDVDVVARYGGDEYVVLLRSTDSGGALKVAERIRRTIEGHHFLAREGYSLTVTTCIGVATFPEHAIDQENLLDLADRAMYRGKRGTRNIIYMAARDLEATPAERHSPPTG